MASTFQRLRAEKKARLAADKTQLVGISDKTKKAELTQQHAERELAIVKAEEERVANEAVADADRDAKEKTARDADRDAKKAVADADRDAKKTARDADRDAKKAVVDADRDAKANEKKKSGDKRKEVSEKRASTSKSNAEAMVSDGFDVDPKEVLIGEPMNDVGYARRMRWMRGQDILWCSPLKSWFVWDGTRWQLDNSEMIDGIYEQVAQATHDAICKAKGEDWKAQAIEALNRMSTRDMRNAIEMLKHMLPVLPRQLDTSLDSFNVLNGTIDLRTRELRPHDRRDMITRVAPIVFDPDATCPRFLAWMDDVMSGDQPVIAFMRRMMGSSLSGHVLDHFLALLLGEGRNGKSTLVRMMCLVMGDYSHVASPTLLMSLSNGSTLSDDVADMLGARFVCASETDDGAKLNEAKMKNLVGGGDQNARGLYQKAFTFTPQWTMFLDTNHAPTISRGGLAIWERIRLVPFKKRYMPGLDTTIKKIAESIVEEEAPGILNWLLAGCTEWMNSGLGEVPTTVAIATDEYREDESKVERFLDERFDLDPHATTTLVMVFKRYQEWCIEQGLQPGGAKTLKQRLVEDCHLVAKKTKNGAVICGIRPRSETVGWT